MNEKIPATVITGFLGAGKTTLIRNLISDTGGRRIALIINEFGDVGVDGGMLAACGVPGCSEDDIIELANGCICCTVADDFLPAMERILAREPRPDHIVIETSGLALPQPLLRAFAWPEVATRVTVDGIVTVVDAKAVSEGRFAEDEARIAAQRAADENLDHESPIAELFEDQVSCADLVVLSKTDLVDAEAKAAVHRAVSSEKRAGARIVEAAGGILPADVLIGVRAAAELDAANRRSHHDGEDHGEDDHDEFESFTVVINDAVASPEMIARRVSAAAAADHHVLRIKGFIAVAGKPMRLVVQGVGPRVESHFDRPWRAGEAGAEAGRLVIIGLKGLDRQDIAAELGGSIA
ncbi:MAG: cobalamin biosynthesis protein CobW [Hyphomicrobiaceae bacterium]